MVKRLVYLCAVVWILSSAFLHAADTTREKLTSRPPLFSGFSTQVRKIDTRSESAQAYFNQGLLLLLGFNFAEAARSFREATRHDPNSAICYWGEALALLECSDGNHDRWFVWAEEAIKQAQFRSRRASDKERGLIAALANYIQSENRPLLARDASYISAMQTLAEQYPDDPDIISLAIKARMDGVNLFHGMINGKPQGETKAILNSLDAALARFPEHIGLLHFNIHASDACKLPERAYTSAHTLEGKVPGSGHLQHMPAHIYYDLGMFHEASEANLRAIAADQRLFAEGGIQVMQQANFYLHNHYYAFHSLSREGRAAEALRLSAELSRSLKDGKLVSTPALRQIFFSVPYLLVARFELWDQIPCLPPPQVDLPYVVGSWHYLLALDAKRKGDKEAVHAHLKGIRRAIKRLRNKQNDVFNPQLATLLGVACLLIEDQPERAQKILDGMNLSMLPWYPSSSS